MILISALATAAFADDVLMVPVSSASSTSTDGNTDWPYLTEVQDWWLTYGEDLIEGEGGLRDRAVALGLPRNTTFLVHAPTGPLLAPAPGSVREADPVQIVLLTTAWAESDFSLSPTSCAKPSRFDLSDAEAITLKMDVEGGLAAADLGSKDDFAEADRYEAALVGQYLTCGTGSLAYTLTVAHPGPDGTATTTSDVEIAVRNTSNLAAIFVPGWDFGTRTEAWIDSSTATDGTQGTIAIDDSVTLGPALYAGAQWMIGGVDYADMRWYNHFANPFFAVGVSGFSNGETTADTARITSPSYLVGTAITPTGGISLAVGASVRPDLNLRGLSEGDPIQSGAAISYESTWNNVRPSLFIGVAIDSQIYNAMTTALSGG